jgi:hypothetical protein
MTLPEQEKLLAARFRLRNRTALAAVTARRGCELLSQKSCSHLLRNSCIAEESTLNKFITLVRLHLFLTNRMVIMLSQDKGGTRWRSG